MVQLGNTGTRKGNNIDFDSQEQRIESVDKHDGSNVGMCEGLNDGKTVGI